MGYQIPYSDWKNLWGTTPEAQQQAIKDVARTIWAESRGEGIGGMQRVANIVGNRMELSHIGKGYHWGDGASEIVKFQRGGTWQFAVWNPSDPNYKRMMAVTEDNPEFKDAMRLSRELFEGTLKDLTNGAEHFHTTGTTPGWGGASKASLTHGGHKFHRLLPARDIVITGTGESPPPTEDIRVAGTEKVITDKPETPQKDGPEEKPEKIRAKAPTPPKEDDPAAEEKTVKEDTGPIQTRDYQIQRGDTLSEIVAEQFDLEDPGQIKAAIRQVADLNGIKDINKIYAGELLKLPETPDPAPGHAEVADKLLPETVQDGKIVLGAKHSLIRTFERAALELDGRELSDREAYLGAHQYAEKHGIKDPDNIQAGQKLVFDKSDLPPPPPGLH